PDIDVYEINGSSANGLNFVRDRIEPYANSSPLTGNHKVCFIDEADFLSKNAQAALRYVVENAYRCWFIFTANDVGKFSSAIRSRLMTINFEIPPWDRDAVILRLRARYRQKLSELEIKFDSQRLDEIVGIFFPDFREIANRLQ